MVSVEVSSAFLVEGEVALSGQIVRLPRDEAAGLVARGKAVVVDPGKGAGEAAGTVGEDGLPVLDEVVAGEDERGEAAPEPPASRGRRKRG